jgi:hypothetical protein
MTEIYRYAAFVSYSSRDARFANRLHGALERYGIPASLGKFDLIGGGKTNRIYPVFRDREELAAGHLGPQIEANLKASAALIVVCSPNSAASPWVQKEIEFFLALGRRDKIFAIIADTAPLLDEHGADFTPLCFPPAFRGDALNGDPLEPLAADARRGQDGFRKSWLKIVAGLIGVSPGQIIDRDRKRRAQQSLAVIAGVGASLAAAATLTTTVLSTSDRRYFLAQAEAAIAVNEPTRAAAFAVATLAPRASWVPAPPEIERTASEILARSGWSLKTSPVLPPMPHDGGIAFMPGDTEIAVVDATTSSYWAVDVATGVQRPCSPCAAAFDLSEEEMLAYEEATYNMSAPNRLWRTNQQGHIELLVPATGAVLADLGRWQGVVESPNRLRIVTGNLDGAVVWDAVTGARIAEFRSMNIPVFSPDGRYAIILMQGADANIHETESFRAIAQLQVATSLALEFNEVSDWWRGLAFTSDSAQLSVISADNRWTVRTIEDVASLSPAERRVAACRTGGPIFAEALKEGAAAAALRGRGLDPCDWRGLGELEGWSQMLRMWSARLSAAICDS